MYDDDDDGGRLSMAPGAEALGRVMMGDDDVDGDEDGDE